MTGTDELKETTVAARLELAGAVGQALHERVKGRDLQLRRGFLQRSEHSPNPPLPRLLPGGRGGHVRIKLIMSILWVAVAGDNTVSFPARVWATLLGLPNPDGAGARRIRDAAAVLEKEGLLRKPAEANHPFTLQPLNETGNGKRYSVPGSTIVRLMEEAKPHEQHRYLKVPSSFWTHGWPAVLDGPALAMLLLLLNDGAHSKEVWIAPSVLADRYGLSGDTRTRGIRQLKRYNLVIVRRRPVSRDVFSALQSRDTYELQPDVLASPPSPDNLATSDRQALLS